MSVKLSHAGMYIHSFPIFNENEKKSWESILNTQILYVMYLYVHM